MCHAAVMSTETVFCYIKKGFSFSTPDSKRIPRENTAALSPLSSYTTKHIFINLDTFFQIAVRSYSV